MTRLPAISITPLSGNNMRQSPHTVTYKDLVALAEEVLTDRQRRYTGAQACGGTNLHALTHQIECAKTLVRILKKCEPGKQADLFSLFNETRK